MTRQRKADIAAALSALLIIALSVVCVLATGGCSTGKVSLGANLSCVAFSVEPKVEFDGIKLGREEIVVTNVTCRCAGAATTRQAKSVSATVEPCEIELTPTIDVAETNEEDCAVQ